MLKPSTYVRFSLLVLGIAALLGTKGNAAINSTTAVTLVNASAVVWDHDLAFDTVNKVFLTVWKADSDQGPWGLFANQSGAAVTTAKLMRNESSQAARQGWFPRVAAGGGKFLVSFYQPGSPGKQRAIFVTYGNPATFSSTPIDIDVADFPYDGNGVAYSPDHNAFLVMYTKNRHTFLRGVKSDGSLTAPFQLTAFTSGDCVPSLGQEKLNKPEIAYDPGSNRAVVTGWRDATACWQSGNVKNGGIWYRMVSFDGSSISAVGPMAWLTKLRYHDDVTIDFAESSNTFVTTWSHINPTTGKRQALGYPVGADGLVSGNQVLVQDSVFSNSSDADDSFNQFDVGFNSDTGQLLLVMRGNDCCGSPLAPVFGLEVDNDNTPIGALKELSQPGSLRPARPYPATAYDSFNDRFFVVYKGPTGKDLKSLFVTTDGTGGGGGGGDPDPPPEPKTLTFTKPTNGSVIAEGIVCGVFGNNCSETYASTKQIELNPYAKSGYVFSGWTGDADCSDGTVTVSGPVTCGAAFVQSGGGGGDPDPPPGSKTLTFTKPTNGSVIAEGILCGVWGNNCSETYASTKQIKLKPYAKSGYVFNGWTGDADCSDGTVTVSGPVTCGAAFVQSGGGGGVVWRTLTIAPLDHGIVIADGIACGLGQTDCSQQYNDGLLVPLTATAAPGFKLLMWLGDADCKDGSVTMNGPRNCSALFIPE